MGSDWQEVFENEWYLVRYSGETPEIALHAALYYLTRAKDGPKMVLSQEEVDLLVQAATARFSEIVVRDLQHANIGHAGYRGLSRSIINYCRFSTFCERQKIDPSGVRRLAAETLLVFLTTELAEAGSGKRPSVINCTFRDIQLFAENLGIAQFCRFSEIRGICLPPT